MFAWKCLRTDMPWSTCSCLVQTKMGKKGSAETPDRFWPYWWPVVGGDTFSSLAPILGPVKKNGHVALFKMYCSWGRNDAKMCRLCRRYLWEGGIYASSYQPRHRNTRERTDLALRSKSTGNNTTLVARQEMHDRIALMSFLCRFPSWAYVWRWCRCCHLLVSIIRVGYVASGMYVMNSTKDLKTIIGFKLNDGHLLPGQFHAVFFSGRWEMLRTSSISSIRKAIRNM